MSGVAPRLVENDASSAPLDLIGCMACYLAAQAMSRDPDRVDPGQSTGPARWPEFRDEARAILVSLDRTVPNFSPRSSAVRDAIAQVEGGAERAFVLIRGGVPRADW